MRRAPYGLIQAQDQPHAVEWMKDNALIMSW